MRTRAANSSSGESGCGTFSSLARRCSFALTQQASAGFLASCAALPFASASATTPISQILISLVHMIAARFLPLANFRQAKYIPYAAEHFLGEGASPLE